LAEQQLQLSRLQAITSQEDMAAAAKRRHKAAARWVMLALAIVFFVLSRYVVLRAQFAQVFDLFKKGQSGSAGLGCAQQNATAWNLVLNVAYPWLGKYQEQPLSQNQANFLWDAVRGQWIPTQTQIDSNHYSSGLGLTPLSYLCGDILAVWNTKTGGTQKDVEQNPAQSPWWSILTSKSELLNDGQGLKILLTEGLWGIAKWIGTEGAPKDMYNYVFAQDPPAPKCNTGARVASVAGNGATFAMAGGMAGGPVGMAVGAAAGIGLGLAAGGNNCGSGCSIM